MTGRCRFDFIDGEGRALSNRFTRTRVAAPLRRQPDSDYRHNLVVYGGECANHLRTYRREVLRLVGEFDETLPGASDDLDMALRLVDRAPLVLVPEFLYWKRVHPNAATEGMRVQGLRFFVDRSWIAWRLGRMGRIRFPDEAPYRLPRLIALGLRETCAQMIIRAAEKRRRKVIMTFLGKLGYWFRPIVPWIVDPIVGDCFAVALLRSPGCPTDTPADH